jgi:CDP-diacylglycerol--serine O-phosphatidyltransferase
MKPGKNFTFGMRKFLGNTKEERRSRIKEVAYRRRYLVPNLVTLGNMFCGYLAIMYATSGRLSESVLTLTIAILLDGLDGRVARKLNATSPFGMEFDSFSDVVSFGVAPAVLMYHWGFSKTADEFGVFITFIFTLCAASRLARFNLTSTNLKGFSGLPTPGAAGAVLAIVHFMGPVTQSDTILTLGTLTMATLSFLMVSDIEFFSIKGLKLQGMSLFWQLMLGATIALVWYNSKIGFLLVALGYVFSGPLKSIFKRSPKNNS